mgnify:FL=1
MLFRSFSGNVNITHTLNEEVTLTNNRPNWLITYRFSYQVDRKGNAFGHIAWEVLTNIGGNANGLNSLFNDSLWAVPWGKVAGLAWKGTGWATQRLLFGGTNRVLWSRGGIAVAGAEATAYAVANGAITLEMTVARRALTTLTNVTSQRFMQPFWRMASKSFASGARGMTPVFIAPRLLTPPSLYLRTERAMLQVNQTQYQFFFIFSR